MKYIKPIILMLIPYISLGMLIKTAINTQKMEDGILTLIIGSSFGALLLFLLMSFVRDFGGRKHIEIVQDWHINVYNFFKNLLKFIFL